MRYFVFTDLQYSSYFSHRVLNQGEDQKSTRTQRWKLVEVEKETDAAGAQRRKKARKQLGLTVSWRKELEEGSSNSSSSSSNSSSSSEAKGVLSNSGGASHAKGQKMTTPTTTPCFSPLSEDVITCSFMLAVQANDHLVVGVVDAAVEEGDPLVLVSRNDPRALRWRMAKPCLRHDHDHDHGNDV
jgi:hypothetical protein